MRHEALLKYLSAVEEAIEGMINVYVESYVEEILTPERANLRIRIRFASGQLLEVNEAVVVVNNELAWLDYRYHCQDAGNRLLFRYDNTPHFPALPTFPHHKHLPDDTIAADKPTIFQALKESEGTAI